MNELSNKDQPKKLEDLFRNGMEEAEMAPSDQLWNRIEHDLDVQEKRFYQKKLAWFQQLAAACVLLLLMAAGYVVYDYQLQHQEKINTTAQQVQINDTSEKLAADSPLRGSKPKNTPLVEQENSLTTAPALPGNKMKIAGLAPKRFADKAVQGNKVVKKKVPTQLQKSVPAYIAVENKLGKQPGKDEPVIPVAENNVTTLPGLALQEQLPDVTKAETEESLPVNDLINSTSIAKLEKAMEFEVADSTKQLPVATTYASAIEEPVPSKTSRWSFSGKYAPHYFNQNITLSQNQPGSASPALLNNTVALNSNYTSYALALDEFDNNTQAGYSFNTEAAVVCDLNKNWGIEAGLAYTQNVANTQTSFIFNNAQVTARYAKESLDNTSFDNIHNSTATMVGVPTTALVASLSSVTNANAGGIVRTQPFTTQYRYQLVGVPVKVHYQTNRTRSFYYASVGFVTNLLVQAHIISDSPRVPNLKYAPNADSPFQNIQVAGVASVGKGFTISKGLRVRAGVEASQYLNTLIDNSIYVSNRRGKPYSLGVAISSSYYFRK